MRAQHDGCPFCGSRWKTSERRTMPFTAKVHGTDTELEATHMWHTCDSCGGGYIGIDGVYARRQVIIAAENAPPRPPDWSAVWAASTLAREAR